MGYGSKKKQTEFYFDKSQESRAELQVKDKELRVIKKIAQDAYTLGVSQATEMDRFWETFGLLDESVSVDDAIAFFKAKDERIAELFSELSATYENCYHKDIENQRLKRRIARLEAIMHKQRDGRIHHLSDNGSYSLEPCCECRSKVVNAKTP